MTSPKISSDSGQESLESLARQAQQGDTQCLERIAERMREPLRCFLVSRVSHAADAEDLAQETLLRAFSRLESYDANRPFKTWLFTIGKRLAVNQVLADKRRTARHSEAHATLPGSVEASFELDIWQRAKATLKPEVYRALWLRYSEDASVKEVAKELGRTVVSTKVLLYRARKRMLTELQS